MISMLALSAHAAVFTQSFDWIVQQSAPFSAAPFATHISEVYLGQCTGAGCPANGSVGAFASDWSRVTCEVRTGNKYHAVLRIASNAWPTAAEWAAHPVVTCQQAIGGNTYKAQINIRPALNPYPSAYAAATLSGGVSATFGSVTYSGITYKTAMSDEVRKLPAGAYIDTNGIAAKKTGGATWPDVTCDVDEASAGPATGTTDFVVVHFGPTAPGGTGYCTFSVNGVPTNFPLSLTR
ncbi:MAG: hypothetical protein ABL912_02015 [Novosphingobium sp.]